MMGTRGRRLVARTSLIPDPGPLENYLTGDQACAFLRRGDGVIGLGEVERFEVDTPDAADVLWAEYTSMLEHDTELPGAPGTGPLAFGTFAFDPDNTAQTSVLVVPRIILGRRGTLSWCTRVGWDALPTDEVEVQPATAEHGAVSWQQPAVDRDGWVGLVADAIAAIGRRALDKVVLSRDEVALCEREIDVRTLLAHLGANYPTTWTYLVDGMVGSTPEMLVDRQGQMAVSRVLAGTIAQPDDAEESASLKAALSTSGKDQREHAFAVASVAQALAPFSQGLHVPDAPYVLELPNVMHLASDITAVVDDQTSALALAAALHPSAAVCGTPTHVARDLIAELEPGDRGRYAGPVGWLDSLGNGEWAVALRGGQIDPSDRRRIRIHAGCGIVADSDPDAELAETDAKLIPMRQALDATS